MAKTKLGELFDEVQADDSIEVARGASEYKPGTVPIPDRPELSGAPIASRAEGIKAELPVVPKPIAPSARSPISTGSKLSQLFDEVQGGMDTGEPSGIIPTIAPPSAPKPSPSLISEFGKGVATGTIQFGEMAGGLAALAGAEDVGGRMIKASQEVAAPYQAAVPSYKEIDSVRDALLFAAHGLGTIVPTAAVAAVTGGVGAAIGKGIAQKALVRELGAEGVKAVGMKEIRNQAMKSAMRNRLAVAGAMTGMTAVETGGIGAAQLEKGEGMDPFKAITFGTAAAVLDVFPEWALAKRLGILTKVGKDAGPIMNFLAGPTSGNWWKRAAKDAARQFALEAPTEGMQTILEKIGAGERPFDKQGLEEIVNSFLIGGIGGLVFGGIGGVFTKPERDQKTDKAVGQVGQVPVPSVTGEEGPNWPGASAIPAAGMFGIKTSRDKAAAPTGAVSDIVPGMAGPTVEPTGSIEGMEALLRSYFGNSEPTIKLINEAITKGPNVFSSVSVVDPFYDYGPDEEGQLPLELTTNRGFPISIKWDKTQAKYVPWGYKEPGDGADEWRKIPVGREWFQKVFDFEKISPVEPTSRTRNIIPTQQIKTLKDMNVPVKFDMSKTTDMTPTAAPAAVTPAAAPIVAAPTVTQATQMLPDPATILTGTVDEVRAVFGIEDDAAAMSFLEKSSLKDTGAGVHYRATSDRVKRTLAPDMASPTPMGSERNLGTFRTPVSYVYNKPSDKEAVIMHRNEMYLVPLTGDLLTFKSPEYKAYRDRASTLVVKEGGAPGDEGLIHHRALKLMAEEGKFAGIDTGARQGLKLTKASPVIPVTTNVLEGMVNSIKSNDGGDFNLFFGRNALPAWSVSLGGNRTGSVRTGRLNRISLRDFITSGDNHTLFAKPQFNLSAKVEGDRINLSVNFLTNDKQQAITEGLQRGLKSIENTATGEIIHMKDWTLRNGEAVLKGSAKARGFGFNNQPDGGNITTSVETYANAEQTGNVWVRQSNNRSNSGRTLLVQFSTTILTSEIEPEAQAYYDKLYAGTRQGYVHPKDFWEIPHWMAIAARSVKQSDVYVVRDVQEAITFLNSAGYDNVAFSALNVNKELIKQIAGAYKGNVVAGGYVDMKEFSGFSNVKTYDFIQNFIQDLGLSVQPGTDYRHFENTEIVPRLKMSQGCLSRCAFCAVTPHGKIIQTEASDIKAQVQAFKSLKAKLVYLDDKTFGQAKNYTMLKDIYQDMKSFNPDFDGFIIQTSAAQMHNLTPEFIRDAGIKYIELGIESFNDPILRAMKKPANEAIILKSIQKIREAGAYLIPNIVIGFPQETAETYARTMQFLRDHRSIISHGNIYNLAVYKGTQLEEQVGPLSASDIDENKIQKSFHANPEIHKKFSDEVFEFMNRRLDDQLRFVDATRQGRGPEGVSYRIGPLYHGTNRDFARFMLNYVGSGDGSQAYGHGLYFTTAKDIAEYYAMATAVKGMHKLSRAKRSQVMQPWLKQINEARERIGAEQYGAAIQDIAHFVAQDLGYHHPFPMYLTSEPLSLKISDLDLTDVSKRIVKEVDLHAGKDPGQYTYLDWDKPAPDVLVSRVTNHLSTTYGITEDFKGFGDAPRGSNLYEITRSHFRNLGNSFVDANKLASATLLELGVDGVRVPAGYTLGKAQPGQFTYVVFDPDEITVRNSISFRRSNIIDVKGGNFFRDNMEFQRMLRMVPPNLGVRVVQSLKDVDIRVRPFERRDDAAVAPITALYDRGGKTGTPQIFIIMDSVTSMKQLQTSFIHEVIGHYGLEQYLGDRFEAFLQMILASPDPNIIGKLAEIASPGNYNLDLDYFPDRLVAAQEYLAFRAESGESSSLMDQLYTYIRQALRWLGFSKLELTDAEIRTALVRSRQIYWTNNSKARTTGWSARAVKGDVWFSQLHQPLFRRTSLHVPKVEGLIFEGVQEIPDYPDQYVFTEIKSGSTFYTKDLSVKDLIANRDRMKRKFGISYRRESTVFTPSTLPSDLSQADNVQQHNTWLQNYKDRKENFTNPLVKDLPRWQEILGLPHWIAKDFQQFEPVTNVQWDRLDKRNADRVMLTRDPESNQGDNFYLTLTDPSRVNQLIVDSDANDIYYSTDADLVARATEMGISLTGDDVKAYHAWKAGMNKAIDYSLNKMRQVTTRIYSDQTWGSMIMDIINGNLDINTIPFDNEKDRKEVLSAVKATQVRLDKVTELETKLRSMNFYMPRVREKGNFVVRVFTTSPEGKVMEMFSDRRASMTAAEALRKQVAADPMWAGMTVTKTEEKPTAEFIHEGMNVVALQAFLDRGIERAQQKHGMDDETANMIFDSVVQSMDEEILARGFRSHHIRRFKSRVIAGYQVKDLQRVFVDYMSGLAGGMSKFEASYDFFKAIGNIDAKTQPNLFQYAGRYMGDMLRNPDATDQIIGKLKSIPFAWYLVSNLRMAAAQFSQNFMTAAPILSRSLKQWGVGGSGATARIVNAMKDVAAKSNLTPEEVQMLDQAMNQGETTANQINEMMGRIEGGWVQQSWGKVMKVASLPFSGMEKLNRQSALLASFRAAREAGKTYEEAYAAAKTFVRDTHYAYGKSNLPQLLREGTTFSKIAGAAYTFRSFTHNYLLSMAYYMKTPDGKLAFDVIGRSFAFMALIGGAVAVPFIDDILDLLEKETGTPYRVHMRRALEGVGGKLLGDVGMQGLPALIGVDISGSIKVGVPFLGDTRNTVYGVWGGLLDKGNNAIDNVLKGDILRAAEAVAPTGLESPFKALRQATEGVTTGKGKPLLGPTGEQIKLTTSEAIAQAGSFRPARIAQVQQERRVQANITEAFNERRQDIYQQMRKPNKTAEDYGRISKEVQKFNMDVQKYRGSIAPISMQTLKQAMQPEKSYMKFKRTA